MDLIKKVPSLTSWLQIQPDIWIPSPYLICPHPTLASEDRLLAECINKLAYPLDFETNPYWKTPIGHTFSVYRQLVCGQFIRGFLDKNFKEWKMPRHWSKTVKNEINSHAELMGRIWRTIRLLPLSANPRPLVFYEINLEGALIFLNFHEEEHSEILTATNAVKSQQKLNRELQSLKNPFEPSLSPETWSFIEQCKQEAERNSDFYPDYMKLIDARMTLLAAIRESRPKKIDQSGQPKEKRGRKSISSSRTRSG